MPGLQASRADQELPTHALCLTSQQLVRAAPMARLGCCYQRPRRCKTGVANVHWLHSPAHHSHVLQPFIHIIHRI